MIHILFVLTSAIIIYIIKHKLDKHFFLENNENNVNINNNENNDNNEEKIFGLTKFNWGWISVLTNGISVLVQMTSLYKSKSAQSFSIPFILLMTLLNFTYFILGILTNNKGLALATFSFIIYNLTVVYYYYYGKKK